MNHQTSPFDKVKAIILCGTVFLFPLFFLPITQEFYVTNKFYLISLAALLLILVSIAELFFTRKITWEKKPFDNAVASIIVAVALSIIISSPNKVQALLSPNLGLVSVIALGILYYYLSRLKSPFETIHKAASISATMMGLMAIIFFFQPFKSLSLPEYLAFLKSPGFTPMGSLIDLSVFLGFFTLVFLFEFLEERKQHSSRIPVAPLMLFLPVAIGFVLTLYTVVQGMMNQSIILPPYRISWYAAIEVLKNPVTAFVGTGVDNFASLFSTVKDNAYNQSSLWQIQSFTVSRSTLLQMLAEGGIILVVAFVLLVTAVLSELRLHAKNKMYTPLILCMYLLLAIVFVPISLPLMFLFFTFVAGVAYAHTSEHKPHSIDLSELIPVYLGTALISLLVVLAGGFFLIKGYVAEYYFKKSMDGYVHNNVKELYDNQRQAVLMNPYIERFRLSFSQTNLLIANNVASKALSQGSGTQAPAQLSEQDRQTIASAIQTAIAEAKAGVSLNSQKAGNWENMANIYRNILNIAQGADVWTISAFQRAIILDPQNPVYRLNLGGVYYALQNFDEAIKVFEQAILIKPDWPNAHYNLAWSAFQKKDYQRAVNEMQGVLSLLNSKTDQADIQKARNEMEEFKKLLPQEGASASPSAETSKQLGIPTPPLPILSPKLPLPEEASQGAR
ncbi:MAG: tetratricopeptide repeat protein [bacterium]|nr:tetratricopeptide repeat protein [bacterium]